MTPLPYAIGNFCEELRFGIVHASSSGKKLAILVPHNLLGKFLSYEPCNIHLINFCTSYSRAKLGIIRYLLLNTAYNIIFITNRLIYLYLIKGILKRLYIKYDLELSGLNHYYSFPRIGLSQLWNSLEKDISLKATQHAHRRTLEEFVSSLRTWVSLKIKQSSVDRQLKALVKQEPIVIHTRSSAYYNDRNRRNRNMDLNDYRKLISYLADHGSEVVVIIGDQNTLEPLHDNVYNLPNILKKEDRRLIELISLINCKIYIGTQSGPWDTALLFEKDIIGLNFIDITTTCIDSGENCKSNYFIKPMKKGLSIKKWLEAQPYDLNTEVAGSLNAFAHGEDFLLNIVSYLIEKYKMLDLKGLKMRNRNYEYEDNLFEKQTVEITSRKLQHLRDKLLSQWEQKIRESELKSIRSYYKEEFSRMKAKINLSTNKNSKVYVDRIV